MSTDVKSSATEQVPSAVAAPAAGDARTSASVRTPMQSIADELLWTYRRLKGLIGTFAPVSGDLPVAAAADATADTIEIASHGFVLNDPVRLMGIGAAVAPAGLAFGTVYFARDIAADTFGVAASSGGAAIDITDAGSGTFYFVKVTDPEIYLPTVGAVAFGKLSAILTRFGQLAASNAWTGANAFSGLIAFTNGIGFGGADFYLAHRAPVTIADASATIKLDGSEDHVITPTANRTIRLSNTDAGGNAMIAGEKKRIRVDCSGANFQVTIGREGTANAIFVVDGAAPYVTEVEVWFTGSVWRGGMHDSTLATYDTEW